MYKFESEYILYVKAVAWYLQRTNIYIYPLQIYQLVSLIPPIDAMKVLDYIERTLMIE